MKPFRLLLYLTMCLSGAQSQASENAQATIFCYSLQLQEGIDPDANYYLDLTSLSGSVNGELAPDFFASGYTHSSYISLKDELLGDTLSGDLVLDVPSGGDANGDGFPDFFQVSQGVTDLPSSGAYFNLQIYGNHSVTALWNRSAGSASGNCVLSMQLMPFQPVRFSFSFRVLEYRGPLAYTPAATNVSAGLSLIQTDNPGSSLNGVVQFVKSPTNRFDELTLQAGTWTNDSQQPMTYMDNEFLRDPRWPTNYFGYLQFTDNSNPGAFYPYALWMLSIDDTNDVNHNSIPDFSDDPSFAPPRQPRLDIMPTPTNLIVTVHGDVGRLHEIQQRSNFGSSDWQTSFSLTLTNDPQQISIALPAGGTEFWRATAR